MSSMYSTEPQTRGRVTLTTTHGDVDCELWATECPHACRSFLELATSGYYDGLPFHRIVAGSLVQTGRRPGSDTEAHLLRSHVPPRDEVVSRIRFARRGMLAMARHTRAHASPDEGDNLPYGQFFVTLDSCPWLDGRHVIFGTVGQASPTIFNLLRVGNAEVVEGTDKAVDPAPAVTGVKVLECPFGDILPTLDAPWREKEGADG
eukprot:CAMPEP_0194292222 /NCGR_PEP_ID=MMETSP0169-20130528/45183_1 /TAXON_ID=218684 /ORGANISM="Corethron pennatum, Strain L29A3" /LENGTH=204 /DNA_ID=CAMNT_0039040339 /DNA_START=28 /DNA_END=638 /DNA_ORIENTATION=-